MYTMNRSLRVFKLPSALILCLLLLSGAVMTVCAQDAADPPEPNGFMEITLGMELEQVKELLQSNSEFLYTGDPDVTILRDPDRTLIEAEGFNYIARGMFQFVDNKLFSITLEISRGEFDHYTLFSAFTEKYGNPDSITPSVSQWEYPDILFSLERPLTVKYIDRGVFQGIIREGLASESRSGVLKEEFLNEF